MTGIYMEAASLDSAQLEAAITPCTKAIIPVHLSGLSADMDAILTVANRHGVHVIEDAAQAIGAKYRGKPVGSMAKFGCFSFFPSKNLGGAGDGGLITTNDRVMADKLNLLRVHGSKNKYEYQIIGVNSRLDALQAAILRVKLRHLDGWAAGRQKNAEHYRRLFAQYGITDAVRPPSCPARMCTSNYFNSRYHDPYTNSGNLMGSWVGREGRGVQLFSTYWFSPQNTLQVGYRRARVAEDFLNGGTLTDVLGRASVAMRPDLYLTGSLQYERWDFPLLSPSQQRNASASIQITYRPQWRKP